MLDVYCELDVVSLWLLWALHRLLIYLFTYLLTYLLSHVSHLHIRSQCVRSTVQHVTQLTFWTQMERLPGRANMWLAQARADNNLAPAHLRRRAVGQRHWGRGYLNCPRQPRHNYCDQSTNPSAAFCLSFPRSYWVVTIAAILFFVLDWSFPSPTTNYALLYAQITFVNDLLVVMFIHRISHGRNIKKYNKQICTQEKYTENIQGPQPDSGQVPTYYVFITITQNTHNIAEQLPLSHLESSFTALATNMLRSLFSNTLILPKKFSFPGEYFAFFNHCVSIIVGLSDIVLGLHNIAFVICYLIKRYHIAP